MSDIEIANIIDNKTYFTNIIPYEKLDNMNIILMNELNMQIHINKIKLITTNIYTHNYTVYNVYKQSKPYKIKNMHNYAYDDWINLNDKHEQSSINIKNIYK